MNATVITEAAVEVAVEPTGVGAATESNPTPVIELLKLNNRRK